MSTLFCCWFLFIYIFIYFSISLRQKLCSKLEALAGRKEWGGKREKEIRCMTNRRFWLLREKELLGVERIMPNSLNSQSIMGNNLLNGSLWLLITYSREPFIPIATTPLHAHTTALGGIWTIYQIITVTMAYFMVFTGALRSLRSFRKQDKTKKKTKANAWTFKPPYRNVQMSIIILCSNPQ